MVEIDSISFQNELRPETTDFLLGNVCEKIVSTINIKVGWFALATPQVPITFLGTAGVGYVTPGEIIKCNSPIFKDFKNGDLINIISNFDSGANARTGVILTKINDNVIRVVGDTFEGVSEGVTKIIGKTPITGIRLSYGLIENNEPVNYQSKITNTNQVWRADGLDPEDLITVVPMIAQGDKDWQNGSATIKGNGIDTYYQHFIITHTFFILPHYLAGQFSDLQNGIKPDYFIDIKSLRYVAKIEGLYFGNDPNNIQRGFISDKLGNSGWFNENFNNKKTNYVLTNIVHRRPTTEIISTVELTTNENTFEITITNTTDSPFVDNDSKFILGFSILPEQDEYLDITKTGNQNFAFDRCLNSVSGATVNGELFGTDEQIFKQVTAIFLSSSQIKITGKFILTQNLIDRILSFQNHRYLLYVITQDSDIATTEADKVTLLIEVDEFLYDTSADGMITFENVFYQHDDPTLIGSGGTECFPGDEVIFRSLMAYDITDIDKSKVFFKDLQIKIFAKKGSETFELENFLFSFANLVRIADIPYVAYDNNRIFKLPLNDDRRLISVQRRTDLDSGNIFYYEILYPFLFRWEYWVANSLVHDDFFDVGDGQNGLNEFWHRFNSLGWMIYIEISQTVDNNGDVQIFKSNEVLPSHDYDSNAEWINEYIKSFTTPGAVELIDGGTKYLQGFADNRIEAYFERTSAFIPTDIVVVIWAEVFEAGGIEGRTRISSIYEVQSESWFKSVDMSNKVKLTFGGGNITVKAEAILDYTKIPAGTLKVEVYARLYEKVPPFIDTESKKLEDGTFKLTEGGQFKLKE